MGGIGWVSISIVPCHTAVDASKPKLYQMGILISNIPRFHRCYGSNKFQFHIFVEPFYLCKKNEIVVQKTFSIDPCLPDLFVLFTHKSRPVYLCEPITKYQVPVQANKSSSLRLTVCSQIHVNTGLTHLRITL